MTFKNREFKGVRFLLEVRLQKTVIRLETKNWSAVVTIKSTPLEAKRYSK